MKNKNKKKNKTTQRLTVTDDSQTKRKCPNWSEYCILKTENKDLHEVQ